MRHWHAWIEKCESINTQPAQGVDPAALGKVWACSEFIPGTMLRYPHLWFELLEHNGLTTPYTLQTYQQQLQQRFDSIAELNDVQLMRQLRLFRHQQMLRIAWRDLTGVADTGQTLQNLTDLAETCVDTCLEHLYQEQCRQLGVPLDKQDKAQRMVVLGMGKLGGCELNFSSDIDLIFCFAEEGETRGARALANSQFFIRLGQRLIKVLNDITADGFVFRVDMRLRPYGDSGPLVMSHGAMEQYYETQGRNWERYAMIKARVIGGDRLEGQAIMDMLRPFIYRRYLDFGAFESIREMKAMINTEIRRKGNLHNIKLGSGGIREIEFIGQTFQLIRGGGDPSLQIRGILQVLALLAEKGVLTEAEAQQLRQSYDFLRRLENRLQMYADQQTHLLPESAEQQLSMALAMGDDSWQSLFEECEQHRHMVHESFMQLLHEPEEEEQHAPDETPLGYLWLHELDDEQACLRLEQTGIAQADQIWQQLKQFKHSTHLRSMSATGRERLDLLMPCMLELLQYEASPVEVLSRLLNLLQSILRRSVYLSLLNEYPEALKQLVSLCAASPWIGHLLSRYPVLLDELLDPRGFYELPTEQVLAEELDSLISQAADDQEEQIERLRKFKQAHVLRIAAMDIAGRVDVFEISEQLSQIARILLQKVVKLAWEWMVARHGCPACVVDGQKYSPSMGVVAYGKMGGRELGYGSDLDLVFLHDSQGEQQYTNGERQLDNASFFARLAQRIIHILSVQTANGRLYEIDMRLRPDGNAGMLVSSVQAYERYQQEKAWTWEHQALVRAQIFCANQQLSAEFVRIRDLILRRQREPTALLEDVVQMRLKMRQALGSQAATKGARGSSSKAKVSGFHLKQDAGGLVDIEFIAQYGVLLLAHRYPQLTQSTATRVILEQLAQCQMLSEAQVKALSEAYRDYRDCSHQRALQESSSILPNTEFEQHRRDVKAIWNELFA